jgi:hypothetical protein
MQNSILKNQYSFMLGEMNENIGVFEAFSWSHGSQCGDPMMRKDPISVMYGVLIVYSYTNAMFKCAEKSICLLLKNNLLSRVVPPDHQLLDRSPNIGRLISRWEPDKFKNC